MATNLENHCEGWQTAQRGFWLGFSIVFHHFAFEEFQTAVTSGVAEIIILVSNLELYLYFAPLSNVYFPGWINFASTFPTLPIISEWPCQHFPSVVPLPCCWQQQGNWGDAVAPTLCVGTCSARSCAVFVGQQQKTLDDASACLGTWLQCIWDCLEGPSVAGVQRWHWVSSGNHFFIFVFFCTEGENI